MTRWIYLSPHFDDVVLSAGGLIWEQTHAGDEVEIWTICAGDPPFDRPLTDYAKMLHIFWELGEDDVPFKRSLEDAAACRVLGASYRRYTIPDNIYRYLPGNDEAVVQLPDDNFGPLEPVEAYLIPPVADYLRKNTPEDCRVVIPLAIGNHRDHVLTRKAAERLGRLFWHYVDYPYIVQKDYNLDEWIPAQTETCSLKISAAGLQAWQDSVACYRSQMVFFWPDIDEMRTGVEAYFKLDYGNRLWKF